MVAELPSFAADGAFAPDTRNYGCRFGIVKDYEDNPSSYTGPEPAGVALEALNEGEIENGEEPQRIDVEVGEPVNMSATGQDDTPNEADRLAEPGNYNRVKEQAFEIESKFRGTTQNPFVADSLRPDTAEITEEGEDTLVTSSQFKNYEVRDDGLYVNGQLLFESQ